MNDTSGSPFCIHFHVVSLFFLLADTINLQELPFLLLAAFSRAIPNSVYAAELLIKSTVIAFNLGTTIAASLLIY